MAVAVVANAMGQFHAQEVTVKADGLLHITGDKSEMVDFFQIHVDSPQASSPFS
jgi:hypothetical protein